jgi:hypothetical protein
MLILPVRLTVSERSLSQGGVEMKLRSKVDKYVIPLDAAVSGVRFALDALEAEIAANVIAVEYNG